MADLPATITLTHKLDVDADEGGCVSQLEFRARLSEGGCRLSFTMGTDADGVARLLSASFVADSFCPGWDDEHEGAYTWDGGPVAGRFDVPDRIEKQTATEACVPNALGRISLGMEMCVGNEVRRIQIEDLEYSGDVLSYGDTDQVCPESVPLNLESDGAMGSCP